MMTRSLLFALVPALAAMGSLANDSRAEDAVDYNRDVRQILSQNCYACHGPDQAKREADLRPRPRRGRRWPLWNRAATRSCLATALKAS